MLQPSFLKYKQLFELNDLSFQTKYDIINSNYVQTILPPYPSFLDKRNIKGADSYNRYCKQANYVSFPNLCLKEVIGLTNRKEPKLNVPDNMSKLFDYATSQGTSILNIQNKVLESIFKFGLAGIHVHIPENVSIANALPKLSVYAGNKIIDYEQTTDEEGNKKFSYVTLDISRYLKTKENNYQFFKLYKVLSITNEDRYCESIVTAESYNGFDPSSPESKKNGVLSITYPSWASELNFIPFVPVSKDSTTIKYGPSFIQDLIDISLQNFRLEANLCWLESNAAASHLVIKGKNLDNVSNFPVGAGAVHLLNDDTAQEYYVTPSTAGMSEIKEHIKENTALAQDMMYSLINASANSSGESLKVRISTKTQDLIGLVKNIGNGITLALEMIDNIINNGVNKDKIEYIPYTEFSNIEEYIGTNKEETV